MVEVEVRHGGVFVGGRPIPEAVPPSWLHDLLGLPDRMVDPAPPAPVGHRNNLIHVYDDLGLYFHEHHGTRLAMGLVLVYWPEEEGYSFTPRRAFSGHLSILGYLAPSGAAASQFVRDCPIPLVESLSGRWRSADERFPIGMSSKGAKLRSGRRSARRRVVSVDLSWMHDPWLRA